MLHAHEFDAPFPPFLLVYGINQYIVASEPSTGGKEQVAAMFFPFFIFRFSKSDLIVVA